MTDMPVPPRTHNADAAADLGFVDLGFAKVDIERRARQGFPEVIFGQGKTPEQMVAIAQEIHRRDGFVLATRVSAEGAHALRQRFPDASWHEQARVVQIGILPGVVARADRPDYVAVVCAGTTDVPVAEEAAVTLEAFGQRVERIYDVGVAGLHRLLAYRETLRRARVLIVAAGLEAALPSVVAGLVSRPVIGLPTSVGYGTSFQGLTAVLGMLNSCGSGVMVVNIDNGFGAAFAAAQICRLADEERSAAFQLQPPLTATNANDESDKGFTEKQGH